MREGKRPLWIFGILKKEKKYMKVWTGFIFVSVGIIDGLL
jgi:hypothetical protein